MAEVVVLEGKVLPWRWKDNYTGVNMATAKKYGIEKEFNTEDIEHEEIKEGPKSPFTSKLKKVYQGSIKGWKDKPKNK